MSVSIKVLNNNYTKEFFDDIYSRVLIFGKRKKQGGPYDVQTHNNRWKQYCFVYGLPDCLYPYIKDKTLPQVCDYIFLKNYVEKFKHSNRAFKNFKHNVHPELRALYLVLDFSSYTIVTNPNVESFNKKFMMLLN